MFRNAKCYCERTVKRVDSLELYDLQKTNKFTDRTFSPAMVQSSKSTPS